MSDFQARQLPKESILYKVVTVLLVLVGFCTIFYGIMQEGYAGSLDAVLEQLSQASNQHAR